MDATVINDERNLKIIAEILQVSERALIDALTKKTIFVHGERVVNFLFNISIFFFKLIISIKILFIK